MGPGGGARSEGTRGSREAAPGRSAASDIGLQDKTKHRHVADHGEPVTEEAGGAGERGDLGMDEQPPGGRGCWS